MLRNKWVEHEILSPDLLVHNRLAFVVGFKTEKHQKQDASLIIVQRKGANPNRSEGFDGGVYRP